MILALILFVVTYALMIALPKFRPYIALGSAAAVAADARVDSRIMMSAGLGAKKLGLFPEGTEIVYGIPLSISGKSPYFDR